MQIAAVLVLRNPPLSSPVSLDFARHDDARQVIQWQSPLIIRLGQQLELLRVVRSYGFIKREG